MSTTNTLVDLQGEDQGQISYIIDLDNPVDYYKSLYPKEKNPRAKVSEYFIRVLASYVNDVHELTLEDAINRSGKIKSELDIVVIAMIEAEYEYLQELTVGFDATMFVRKDPQLLSNKAIFDVKHICGR